MLIPSPKKTGTMSRHLVCLLFDRLEKLWLPELKEPVSCLFFQKCQEIHAIPTCVTLTHVHHHACMLWHIKDSKRKDPFQIVRSWWHLCCYFLLPFTTLFQGPCYEHTVIILHIMMHLTINLNITTYAPFLMLPLIHLLMYILCPWLMCTYWDWAYSDNMYHNIWQMLYIQILYYVLFQEKPR